MMDKEDDLAVRATNTNSTLQSESPSQLQQDASHVPDHLETEDSLPTSQQSPIQEINLPPLIQEERPEGEEKIFPSEIPDSEAVSPFTSPVKPRQAVHVEELPPDARVDLIQSLGGVEGQQDVAHSGDVEMGDGAEREDGNEGLELPVDDASEVGNMQTFEYLKEGGSNVQLADPGTDESSTAPDVEGLRMNDLGENEDSTIPDESTMQENSVGEDEEMRDVTTEGDCIALESAGSDADNEASTSPTPKEGTLASIGHDVDPLDRTKATLPNHVAPMEPLSTASEQRNDAGIPQLKISSDDSSGESEAQSSLPNTLDEKGEPDNEALQTIKPSHSPNLVENAPTVNHESLEMSTADRDGEDTAMGDELPSASKPVDHSDQITAIEERTWEDTDNVKKSKDEEVQGPSAIQKRSIADSDDEELSDVALTEHVPDPEPEPKVSKKGRKNSKTTEKPVEKVAKKRGRPEKMVASEVQQPRPSGAKDYPETIHDSAQPMDLEEQSLPPQSHLENSLAGSTKITPDTDPNHDGNPPQEPSSNTPKATTTPINSSPPKPTFQTPIKVRTSPNPSFRLPSPIKKSQSQSQSQTQFSSSSMNLSSPTRKPSSLLSVAAISTSQSQEGDDISESQDQSQNQNQTRDAVLGELKAMKMASIQARISALQVEIEAKKTRRDELGRDLIYPASETVKRHIKLLHDYNDIKDIGQGLVGMIADQRGLRIAELYEEFGVDVKD